MEGYDVECVDDVSKDFYCVICHKLIREAIQIKCGHGMCGACFQQLRSSNEERGLKVVCPMCRNPILHNEVMSVPMFDRVISSLKIKCTNSEHGCLWVGKLETLSHHLKECPFILKKCHLCIERIPGCKLDKHTQLECSNTEVVCPYKFTGCEFKILRRDLDKHLADSSPAHIEAMMEMLTEKDKTIIALQEENESLKTEVMRSQEQLREFLVIKDSISKINKVFDKMSKYPDGVEKLDMKSDVITCDGNDTAKVVHGSSCKHKIEKNATKKVKEEGFTLEGCKEALFKQLGSLNLPLIDNSEVSDSLKFITFRAQFFKGSLNQSDIVEEAVKLFVQDISDNEKCFSDLMEEVHIKGFHDSLKLTYNEEYWKNTMSKLIYISTDAFVKNICSILLLFQQLKVLQQGYDILNKCREISIGKYVYHAVKLSPKFYSIKNVIDVRILESGKLYLMYNYFSAKEIMLCHRFSSKTVSAGKKDKDFVCDVSELLHGFLLEDRNCLVKILRGK